MQTIELTLASITGAVIDAVDAVPGVLALAVDETTMLVRTDGASEATIRRAIEGAGGEVLASVPREPPAPDSPDVGVDGPDVEALLSERLED